MRHIIAIIDTDTDYANTLAEYINDGDKLHMKAMAYSSVETYRNNSEAYKTEILLINENFILEYKDIETNSKIIMLSEDGFIKDGGEYFSIFKYREAQELLREIMSEYSQLGTEGLIRVTGKKSEIVGIYSPVNRCGKTSMAITYGMIKASGAKTLLITLEEYSGIFRNLVNNTSADLSDVIYHYLQGNYSWSRLKSSVYSLGKLDFIPPARYAEDILELDIEELSGLFLKIASESDYEYIVIDFGTLGKKSSDLLDFCNMVYMPIINEKSQKAKVDEYMEYLSLSGRDELKKRIHLCELPKNPEQINREDSADYCLGELYDYVNVLEDETHGI